MLDYYVVYDYEFCTIDHDVNIYSDLWVHGLIFRIGEYTYDIHYNKAGLARIFINNDNGEFKDLPLNDNTIKLLPQEIKVRKII